jgi:hypothetical protein
VDDSNWIIIIIIIMMEDYETRIPVTIVTAIFLSALILLLTPPIQHTPPFREKLMDAEASTSSVIKFPIVNRADYNDPASGIVNLDLFDSALLGSGDSVLVVPFPTGAFWTNFVVDPDPDGLSYPIVTYPFAYKWKDQLLQVSYPALRRRVDVLSIIDTFNPDVTFGSVESMSRRTILAFDPLSLTIRYATDSDDASWDTYLVHGSPYITAKYMETTPLLTTLSIFNKVMCSTGASYQDGDSTFKAFAAKKLTWSDCATPSSVRDL